MKLEAIATGTLVFVDANVFVYAFTGAPDYGPACADFLERIELGELKGVTSTAILSEVAHRLMTLEACDAFGWPYAGIAQRLRQHPEHVEKLRRFREAVQEIVTAGIQVFAVSDRNVLRAAELSQQHGLLSNDALVVAVMEDQRVQCLASNDGDFDRLTSVSRYAPL